jgi:hypothetical protein
MKTITTLSLILLLTGVESTDTFWDTFKTAVSKHDVENYRASLEVSDWDVVWRSEHQKQSAARKTIQTIVQ